MGNKDRELLFEKIEQAKAECQNLEKGFWYNFGVEIAGPMYLGLYKWLREETKEADTLFFLSRDGFNLYNLFKNRGHNKAEYLYVSRRSLILAGITQLDEESLAILPPFTFGQTVGEIFDYLRIDREGIKYLEKAGFDSFESVIKDSDDYDNFKMLYKLNEEFFLNRCRVERENAVKYFKSTGFLDEDAHVFDCGWNGSSQYLIERFKEAIGCEKMTLFYYFGILNTEKSRKQLHGKRYTTYLFDFYKNYNLQRDVSGATVMYELLFSASHPSVYYYGEDGPVFESGENEVYKDDISDGIKAFVGASYDLVKDYTSEIPAEQFIYDLKRLISNPTTEEAVTIGNIDNVDGFARKAGADKKIAYITEKALEDNPMTEVYWIQGLLKREDVSENVKKRVAERERYSVKADTDYNLEPEKDLLAYKNWMLCNEGTADSFDEQKLVNKPLFSLVMPVYNVVSEQLGEAIESVLNQTYDNFELILVDDHSTWDNVRPVLKEYESNSHVKVIYRSENGHISRATNDGIDAARGEYLFFMDCDDTIDLNAFMEFALLINDNPELDFIYSDEDKLTEDGKIRHLPFFKPDWSPDLLWCENYTNHLSAYRMSIAKKIGGLRSEYDGAQDYDFVLRFMEESDDKRVGHISKILYHWRERKESVAFSLDSKNYATEATKYLKEDALRRRNISGYMEYVSEMSQYRVVYTVTGNPLVSIIIPSKDNPGVLKQCIDSVINMTDYRNFEIVVVDNGSSEENRTQIAAYLEEKACTYLYDNYDFNFSYMCNLGAKEARGEYLLFLNDDVEVLDGKWLERMLGESQQKHVGAVGAKLFYPETTLIQHSGISNLKEGPGHALLRQDDSISYYFGLNRLEGDYIAVTAACMMISKAKFMEAGMLDESLRVAYNDIDLCFKLHELGYYNVVRQDAVLYHHESLSRGDDAGNPEKAFRLSGEKIKLYLKHQKLKGRDPFLNRNIHNHPGYELDLNQNGREVIPFREPDSSPFGTVSIDCVAYADGLSVDGWAFLEDKENTSDMERYLILKDGYGDCVKARPIPIRRLDVVNAFGGRKDLEYCGFRCHISSDNIGIDVVPHKIGIQIIDKDGNSHIFWDEKRGYLLYNVSYKIIYNDFNILNNTSSHIEDCNRLMYSVDLVRKSSEGVEIKGWAFLSGEKPNAYKTSLIFESKDGFAIELDTEREIRPDVAAVFYENPFLTNTGFGCYIHPEIAQRVNIDTFTIRLTNLAWPDEKYDVSVKTEILE